MSQPQPQPQQTGGERLGEGGFGVVQTPQIPCQKTAKGAVQRITPRKAAAHVSKIYRRKSDREEEFENIDNSVKLLRKKMGHLLTKRQFFEPQKRCFIPPEFYTNPRRTLRYGPQYGVQWFLRRREGIPNTIAEESRVILPKPESHPMHLIQKLADADLFRHAQGVSSQRDVYEQFRRFINIFDAVITLQKHRLLHGDLKLENMVFDSKAAAANQFKIIDIAGITSYDNADLHAGRFKFALSYLANAGQFLVPPVAPFIVLQIPRSQYTPEMNTEQRAIMDTIIKKGPLTVNSITKNFLSASMNYQSEAYDIDVLAERILGAKAPETIYFKKFLNKKSSLSNLLPRVQKHFKTSEYLFSRWDTYGLAISILLSVELMKYTLSKPLLADIGKILYSLVNLEDPVIRTASVRQAWVNMLQRNFKTCSVSGKDVWHPFKLREPDISTIGPGTISQIELRKSVRQKHRNKRRTRRRRKH